jgi:hypothetical protein
LPERAWRVHGFSKLVTVVAAVVAAVLSAMMLGVWRLEVLQRQAHFPVR